ncbi:MAG: glycosyltransferase family 4 protein [Lachnospiraceae bacterium]|nr:glycosyltransferase family 4 protein [Lachnospiraceae bacterium]
MKLTFVSNYINHHQIPLCTRLYETYGADFSFVETEPMSRSRTEGGWKTDARALPYVRFRYEAEAACDRLFLDSDIVLLGWSALPGELIAQRLSSGKITLRISERIYKEGQWKAVSPRGIAAKRKEHTAYRDMPVYMLCADAYAASDFRLIRSYPDKLLRWGYFPETQTETAARVTSKEKPLMLCWAGRMINWKHPEYALRVAETLHNRRYDFILNMIGDGAMREALSARTADRGLQNRVLFKNAMTPRDVREMMRQSDVFLFTSSYLEGWGAVVNEAMNSGCAVVASDEAGSVPYLIRSGVNGLTYHNNSYKEFERRVLQLAADSGLRARLGTEAYRTIANKWNAEEAGSRLIRFCETLFTGGKAVYYDDDGPLSRAPILRGPGFFRTLREHTPQDHGSGL